MGENGTLKTSREKMSRWKIGLIGHQKFSPQSLQCILQIFYIVISTIVQGKFVTHLPSGVKNVLAMQNTSMWTLLIKVAIFWMRDGSKGTYVVES